MMKDIAKRESKFNKKEVIEMAYLRKKLLSLVVSVVVIAAFALLGSMMVPTIGEKMGLGGSRCFAEYAGYRDEDDTDYRNKVQCDMLRNECFANCKRTAEVFDYNAWIYCNNKYPGDEDAIDECFKKALETSTKCYKICLDQCSYKYPPPYCGWD